MQDNSGKSLSFSRRAQTKKAVCRINDVMDEVLSVVQHHFELEKIVIKKEFAPRIPAISMDEAKMKQVFMNLIMNARQAMKTGNRADRNPLRRDRAKSHGAGNR